MKCQKSRVIKAEMSIKSYDSWNSNFTHNFFFKLMTEVREVTGSHILPQWLCCKGHKQETCGRQEFTMVVSQALNISLFIITLSVIFPDRKIKTLKEIFLAATSHGEPVGVPTTTFEAALESLSIPKFDACRSFENYWPGFSAPLII